MANIPAGRKPPEPGGTPPWPIAGRTTAFSTPIFTIAQVRTRSPRTAQDHDFYVLDTADWVNVIALTDDDKLVMIRQYRHGTREVTLEIPGGVVDADDPSPLAAARRELLEETGYRARTIEPLGSIAPNPAIQSNHCHSFVARDLERAGPQQLDHAEQIEVVELSLEQVLACIARGEVTHALVVVAFYWYLARQPGGA